MSGEKRTYNAFFNTHTVSGIVISVGLFVCFFAGAFALFMDEINHWQEAAPRESYATDIDYERVIAVVEQDGYKVDGRNFFVGLRRAVDNYIQVSSQPLKQESDSTETAPSASAADSLAHANIYMKIDPKTYAIKARKYKEEAHLGTFLYHLHYFRQLPAVGIYLSGLVALFFTFALFTGIIVHWKKIVSNFFTFRLKSSIKNLWTDSHTALGVIGLPFQLMYAVTGSFFGLFIVLYLPFMMVVFDNDEEKMMALFRSGAVDDSEIPITGNQETGINQLVGRALKDIDESDIEYVNVQLSNYNEENAQMTVTIELDKAKHFLSSTNTTYRLADGVVLAHKPFDQNSYADSAITTLGKLHFAHFGGYLIKVVYFVLAMMTCFVIISGVMIWLVAREKKAYAHKAKFNRNVGAIYLGACLGLYPAVALFFCLVKILPLDVDGRFEMMSNIFFLFWLAYTIYAFVIKNNFKINQHAMFLAGALGIMIPVLNGMQTGIWFWRALPMGYTDTFLIDASWLFLGLITLIVAFKVKPVNKKKATDQDVFAPLEAIPIERKSKAVRPRIKEKEPVLAIKPTRS